MEVLNSKLLVTYINMDKSVDRRINMEKRFKKFNINVIRKCAITPEGLNIKFNHTAQHLNKGEKACTQSHVEIMKDFLTNDKFEYLLIFEDDMKLRHDFIEVVNKKLETIDKEDPNWDSLFLYTTEGLKHYSQANAGIPMDEEDKKSMNVWRPIREHYSSGAYILSKKGIQEIFSMFNDYSGYHKSDWMTWCLQSRGHCYGIFPWIACIDESESCLVNRIDSEGGDPDFRKAIKLLKEVDYSYDNYE
jgi:GR25 family glycosyltransferase involved in LPS biosynthesis